MGKRTHGPYLIAAIEYGDIEKVSHILSTKFRDKSKVKTFLASEVRRLASEYAEVPLMLAATLADPTIIKYFVTKHEANVNFVYEYGHQVYFCTVLLCQFILIFKQVSLVDRYYRLIDL